MLTSIIRRCSTNSNTPKAVPLFRAKKKSTKNLGIGFVDTKKVKVQGGKGGDGGISFLRIFANDRAGPDGGDGGNGGHVMFQADFNVSHLSSVPVSIKGTDGENGMNKSCFGKNADPLIIPVPFGTVFKNENNQIVADLCSVDKSVFLAARGGSGGRGNRFFATAANQAPEIAEFGAEGESFAYSLELTTIAHVGLVGFPNAGKSTFLQSVTRARPKVADYPFTTLQPHVGMVFYDDYERVAIADIPGLIEDAHRNRGLGIDFLRHIQRCLCLAYVIDLSSQNPWDELQVLYNEISHFDPTMLSRPSLILGNKMDLPAARENVQKFKDSIGDVPFVPISAKNGVNLREVLDIIKKFYDSESKKLNEKYLSKEKEIDHSNRPYKSY